MSELTQIQSKIEKQQSESPTVQRADVLPEDVMVDALQEEQQEDPIVSLKESMGDDVTESASGYLNESLFEELSKSGILSQTTSLLSNLFGTKVAALFTDGDPTVVGEIQRVLVDWLENGTTRTMKSQLITLEENLQQITPEDSCLATQNTIDEMGSFVRSTLVAFDAMHAEGLGEQSQTILAFQNLTRQEAAEVEEDLNSGDESTMTSEDRERIMAGDITMIEVEEVLVDFWEAAQKEKYEVEDEDKI